MAQEQAYYEDNSDSDAHALLVVEVDGDDIRYTENSDYGWGAPVWTNSDEFDSMVSEDGVEVLGLVKDEKFDTIVSKASVSSRNA
jgi:hypothetical protein